MKGSRSTGREPFAYARLRPWAWYTLILILASICVFGGVAADPGGQVSAGNDDSSLFIWWLGHGAEVLAGFLGFGDGSVAAGEGFLFTDAMNALGGGVNGAWNTSLTGIAIVLAPLTWVAGPIIAYNVLILAIPVLNSLATAVLFTRFLRRGPAFAAAAGVGFSSYTIARLSGHPNLAFAIAPPLVAKTRPRPPRRTAAGTRPGRGRPSDRRRRGRTVRGHPRARPPHLVGARARRRPRLPVLRLHRGARRDVHRLSLPHARPRPLRPFPAHPHRLGAAWEPAASSAPGSP